MAKPGLFGNLMKFRRRKMDLTMDYLAKKIRTTKGYISGVENGRVAPFGPKKIPKVALTLGLPVNIMLFLAWADKSPRLIRNEVQTMVVAWVEKYHGLLEGLEL